MLPSPLFSRLQLPLVPLATALSLLLAHRSALAQTSVWSGADARLHVSTNWSDANNWSGGIPGAATNVYFFDPGTNGAAGVPNNVVDGNRTILSLQYGNTNGFHTTQINSGVKLTVSNTAAATLVYVGTGTDNGIGQSLFTSLTGAGSLAIVGTNAGSLFAVQQGSANSGTHMATLDLSGLATFNLTAGRLMVGGANPGSGANNWLAGTLYLAATNTLRLNGPAPALDVGDSVNNGATSYLYLGQTNALFADSMTVAHSKATATLSFDPGLTGSKPVLNLSGNTNSRMALLSIGDFAAQTGSAATTSGNVDFTGGTVNAQVDTCYVGRGQTGSGPGPALGTLSLGSGAFNVNTLNVGYISTSAAVGNVTGTVNLTNGTLVVNSNLLLAYDPGATAAASGALNLSNSTVLANTILAGGGTAKIVLNNGLLAVTNTLASPAAPLTSLAVSNGATLQFSVANHRTNASATKVVSDNSSVINIASLPIVLTYPSQYPLIFSPAGGASGVRFTTGTLPDTFRGYISNDNSSLVWLVITNGPTLPKTIQWVGGVNGNWDTNTLNWVTNGLSVAYRQNDLVVFDDSAQTNTVTLVGTLPYTPYAWTVTNNVVNYKFAGTNSISGPVALVKSGAASLTLTEGGDSFSGGLVVNGGTVFLDQAGSAASGGMSIAPGATVQVGNNDARGVLPSGPVANNGSLVFSQTSTNLLPAPISGTGTLTKQGSGTLLLSGTNTYAGNTVVFQGALGLSGTGSIAGSANVIVTNATLDLSRLTGPTVLGNLNLTNSVLTMGTGMVSVAGLNLGGTRNTLNVAVLPDILFYPTNFTLIQSSTAFNGTNFALGSLPAASPAYAGSLAQTANAVVLTLTNGPLAGVAATVSFSSTNSGWPVNPAFCGLSYEKSILTGHLFVSSNTSMINMFSQIAPAVLRIGGNSVDTTCWGGLSNKTPITASQVDALAGFVKALPTNWHVIYGINMSVNTLSNCADEAAYAANALGSSLLGFEIGNENDLYSGNGIRPTTYTYSQFLSEWRALAGAITNAVPGWAITNGGNGWTLTGPASAYNTQGYTVPFAKNETGVVSMVTQHYYRADGQNPSSTLDLLLLPDTSLPGTVSNIVSAATSANLPLGFRMAECGSFYNGGAPNVSNGYGTALWALDFMFTIALKGGQGINFHGGGSGPGYTPIADNGTTVIQARPEFYGLKMFSLASQGNVLPATLSLGSNINFTAYGIRRANGAISAVLVNKDTNEYARVSLNLGAGVTSANYMELTGPTLNSTNGYTLGGAPINPDGSWSGGFQASIPATNGQLTVFVPPISAVLLAPVLAEQLLANDALNTSSWTGSTNWSDGLAPHAGASYFTLTNLLRTPAAGSPLTFAGDSLTLGPSVPGNTSLRLKFYSPGGTCIINNCTNAGGIIDAGVAFATNCLSGSNWVVTAPAGFGFANDNTRAIVLTNLQLSGSAALSNGVADLNNGLGTIVYACDATDFTGPLVTSVGTTLQAYSQTNLGGNPASFSAAQFVLDSGIFQPLASLALTNANSGITLNAGGGTFNVAPGLTLSIANPVAGPGGLVLQGGGLLLLAGTNSYTGPTTISAGTLALKANASLSASPSLTVAGGATLDVSGLSSPFALGPAQTLSNSSGYASLSGTNSTGPGTVSLAFDGISPCFIITNGSMTLSGSTVFRVNNAGPQLAAGTSYKLLARATTGTPGLVTGSLPASVSVSGNGAANTASLAIVGGELYLNVAPLLPGTGTNLTLSVTANQLALSWPSNYTGWLLQSNSVSLSQTNAWFTVPGSATTNLLRFPIISSRTNLFYRMVHP